MQLSIPFTPSKLSPIFPFANLHGPPQIHHLAAHIHNHRRASFVTAVRVSGYFSSISRAIEEEEEYRKARAAVNRKGVELDGYAIEGVSVGGHETCLIVPELKCVFDIGRCPSRAIQQKFLFITHAHLDHIGGLPMYVASRGLYNLDPPKIFVPPSIKEDVEKLLEIHRTMGQVELNVELIPLHVKHMSCAMTLSLDHLQLTTPYRVRYHTFQDNVFQHILVVAMGRKFVKLCSSCNQKYQQKLFLLQKDSGQNILERDHRVLQAVV